MNRSLLAVLLAGIDLVTLCDFVEATPRRRRRINNNVYYQSHSTRSRRVAPKFDSNSSDFRKLLVNYSYLHALQEEMAFADRLHVVMSVWEEQIVNSCEDLVPEVRLTDLSECDVTHTIYLPVTITQPADVQYVLAEFDITNPDGEESLLEPAKVYRLSGNLHRVTEQHGGDRAWGHVPLPYYVATSDPR